MSKDPILVLQMQRMGDLIMTFPLLIRLLQKYPGHPVWVAAEEQFFSGLMSIAPPVTFFPAYALHRMRGRRFHLVLNLSHRPEAAALGPQVQADAWFGPRQDKSGNTYIHGQWQMYRASLTHNNRHNRFHWSDLNELDAVPYTEIRRTRWNPVSVEPGKTGVGLFLGASEPAKMPGMAFWVGLVRSLLKKGVNPVLLGGEAERPLGREVARRLGLPRLNLTGRFDVPGLAAFISNLQLLVTPDTGPMHLAAWLGVPVINLSMGPVNAWDTGPVQPAHLVLRSNISCRGCWQCGRSLACHRQFVPARVAAIVTTVLSRGLGTEGGAYLSKLHLPGQEMLFTARRDGLFDLIPAWPDSAHSAHTLLGNFWRCFFGAHFGLWESEVPRKSWQILQAEAAALPPAFDRALSALTAEYAVALKTHSGLGPDFWRASPPLLRPLSGYLHLLLQNGDYRPDAFVQGTQLLDFLSSLTEK